MKHHKLPERGFLMFTYTTPRIYLLVTCGASIVEKKHNKKTKKMIIAKPKETTPSESMPRNRPGPGALHLGWILDDNDDEPVAPSLNSYHGA